MAIPAAQKCQHVEPPPMTEEEIKDRLLHLEQRHLCLDCGRKIFSRDWLEWKLAHDSQKWHPICKCACHNRSMSTGHCRECAPKDSFSLAEAYEAAAYYLGTNTFSTEQMGTVESCINILKSRAEDLRKHYGVE